VGPADVRWDKDSKHQKTITYYCMEISMLNPHFRNRRFLHKGIISAVTSVEFISGRISYITLTGSWYDTVLNVPAPTEDKSDDTKDNFNEELFYIERIRSFPCGFDLSGSG
jgi:hypothetical protein